ncbi:hypothetical protein RUM44_008765 [Polyplax serrata]|uniref:Uncharacterized protein n=1 Tax=Polyplax serrata TaxID=468196 RepID=A0ABR1BD53_POLSC
MDGRTDGQRKGWFSGFFLALLKRRALISGEARKECREVSIVFGIRWPDSWEEGRGVRVAYLQALGYLSNQSMCTRWTVDRTQEDTAMGGLKSGPGPGITLLIAIIFVSVQITVSAVRLLKVKLWAYTVVFLRLARNSQVGEDTSEECLRLSQPSSGNRCLIFTGKTNKLRHDIVAKAETGSPVQPHGDL